MESKMTKKATVTLADLEIAKQDTNETVVVGDKIIIRKGNEKTAIAEGLTATIISVVNTQLRAEVVINENSHVVSFMADGRDGTIFHKYNRSHRVLELQQDIALAEKKHAEAMIVIEKNIERLSFGSDEAYDDAKFAARVKAVR